MKKKFIGIMTAVSCLICSSVSMGITAFAENEATSASSSATTQAESGSVFWTLIFPLIIMFVLLYFMVIRPQKKRDNELKDMQNSLEIGDEIVTGGGIVGIVVSTGDDTVVIETGGARQKLRIKTWAITENVSAQERIKAAKAASSKKKESTLASAGVVEDDSEKKSKKNKKKSEEE